MVEQSLQQNEENPIPFLTQREKEVLRCLSRGKSNREIATALGIAECTVNQHLQNISVKVGVNGSRKLQTWAWKHGFGEK
jgi:DNA-binding NarL/FixJ family response regulator